MKSVKCITQIHILFKEGEDFSMLIDTLCKEGVVWEEYSQVIPFGKSFVKQAASSGKKFLKSDLGRDIINDTIASAATAASSALLEQDPNEAKNIMKESLKRSQNKSKAVVKRIARDKLDQVLTGSGGKRIRKQRQRLTLLDL
jgi:hypothetical protein